MTTNDRLLLTVLLFVGLVTRPAFGDTKPDAGAAPLIPPPPLVAPGAADTTAVPPPVPPAPAPSPDAAVPPTVTEMPVPAAKPAAHAKKKSTKSAAKSTKAKSTKTAVAKKAAAPKIPDVSVPLKPGTATVTVKRVNLRGKPTITSEVLGHLTNTEPVTVIEEIRRDNKRPDDPDVWAKIALPGSTHAWVNALFVDSNKVVTAKKLNVRGGPSENYSVVGLLKKGDTITQQSEKSGWLEITPPADAYVYVAAAYLKQETAAAPVEPVAPAPAPETSPVTEGTPIAGAPTEAPATPAVTPEPPTAPAPEAAQAASPAMPPPNLPMILDPSIKRIVDREGVVRRTWSIQAPSDYRLVSTDTGESIVYLHTTSTNLDLSRYKGLHIIVTGEEGMDRRWKNVPVLTIRRIQVIE